MKFRRQQPIGPYFVDFVCFECKVIIEVDGGQHLQRASYDTDRTRWLEAQGYRVLRFWNGEVLANTDAVAQVILDCIDPPTLVLLQGGRRWSAKALFGLVDGAATPPPQSSPAREEEAVRLR